MGGQCNATLYINTAVNDVFFQNNVLAQPEILQNFKMPNYLLIKNLFK